MTLLTDVVDSDYLKRREESLVQSGPGVQAIAKYGEFKGEAEIFPKASSGEYALMRLGDGATREEVEAELGGVVESMYSPADVLIDVATGGATAAGRTGFKMMGQGAIKQGAKLLGRNVAQDVGYGALAVALMDQARDAGADPVVEVLTGILGPTATTGLLQMSRKGLAQWLKNVSTNNRDVYSSILEAVEQGGDGKASKVLRELVDSTPEIEAPAVGMSIKNVSDDVPPVPKDGGESGKPSLVARVMDRFKPKSLESKASVEPIESVAPPALVEVSGKTKTASHTLLRDGLHEPSKGKAVNINFEYIDTADDVKGVIEKVGELYRPSVDKARRGLVKEDEIKSLANDLGMREETLLSRNVGEAYNAEQLHAARWVVTQSAEELVSLAKRIRSGENSDELLARFQKRTEVHSALQSQLSGAVAEAGRALRQQRMVAKTEEMKLHHLSDVLAARGGRGKVQDMADMLAKLADESDGALSASQVNSFMRQATRATTSDMLMEAWINALLSGPQTHATNTLSNSLVALWQIPERALAGAIGKVSGGEVMIGEVAAQGFGLVQGIQDGLRIAGKGFKDIALLRPVAESDSLNKVETRFNSITAENVRQTFAGKAAQAAGVNLEEGGVFARGIDLLGEAIRVPGKALGVEDDFFKAVGYRMELNAQAYRQAVSEGLDGEAMTRRMAEIVSNPPEHIQLQAIDAARYQTFTQELGKFGQAVQKMASAHPVTRVVLPFVRTPANVMKFALERTPAAIAMQSVRADIKAGGARRDLALARVALGSSIMAYVGSAASSDYVTGGGPSDSKQRNVLRDTGWQPYSIKIGDKYYSYSRLEPLGSIMGLAADASEIMLHLDDEAERERLAATIVMSISKNVTSKTFLRGISEAVNAMSDPDRYGERYVQKLAGTVVPTGVAQINRTFFDSTLRETRSFLDEIKSRVPGLSDSLPPRRNIWGEPVTLSGSAGPDLLSPIYSSDKKSAPASEELLRLGLHLSRPMRRQSFMGISLELSPEEFDRFQVLAGDEIKDPNTNLSFRETVAGLAEGWHVNAKDYAQRSEGPDGGKAYMIRQYRQMYMDLARRQLVQEFPELLMTIEEGRLERQ